MKCEKMIKESIENTTSIIWLKELRKTFGIY